MENELIKMDLSGERFPAISYSPGCVGCSMSHIAVLEIAKQNGYNNVLIFEDDFQFLVTKEELQRELKSFFDLQIPYDVVMLSYSAQETQPFNDDVCRGINVQTLSGYIVHNRFYDKLISHQKEGLQKLRDTGRHWEFACYQYCKSLQPICDWFCFNKRLGIQRPSYSDLAGCFVDYKV